MVTVFNSYVVYELIFLFTESTVNSQVSAFIKVYFLELDLFSVIYQRLYVTETSSNMSIMCEFMC